MACGGWNPIADLGEAASDVAGFVYNNASAISAASGVLAVVVLPIPGVDALAPVLGGISVATGAIATSKDIAEHNYIQAVIDGTFVFVGGAGLAEDLAAQSLARSARAAWDSGDLYSAADYAHLAEGPEANGQQLDRFAAAGTTAGWATDKMHLFEHCDS